MNGVDEPSSSDAELLARICSDLRSSEENRSSAHPNAAETGRSASSNSTGLGSFSPAALKLADRILGISGPESGLVSDTERPSEEVGAALLLVADTPHNVPSSGAVVGRRPGRGGIIVDDARVSRRHCRIESSTEGLAVVDLGSLNGTVVSRGDERIDVAEASVSLLHGDLVMTRDSVMLAEVFAESHADRGQTGPHGAT